jgi:NADH-quinone oxidoreductase subunit F
MDKSTDIVKAIARILLLQARELRPVHAVPRRHRLDVARDGAAWCAAKAQKREIDMLLDVTKQIEGHTICALGDAAAWPIQGLMRHFRGEIERRIDEFSRNPRPIERQMMEAAE